MSITGRRSAGGRRTCSLLFGMSTHELGSTVTCTLRYRNGRLYWLGASGVESHGSVWPASDGGRRPSGALHSLRAPIAKTVIDSTQVANNRRRLICVSRFTSAEPGRRRRATPHVFLLNCRTVPNRRPLRAHFPPADAPISLHL